MITKVFPFNKSPKNNGEPFNLRMQRQQFGYDFPVRIMKPLFQRRRTVNGSKTIKDYYLGLNK